MAGIRPALADIGITPNLRYVTQTLANMRGGSRKVVRTSGQFLASASIDLDKLARLPGTFQATITRRHGKSFNSESGLNLPINPQAINGRGEVWRVGQLWYQVDIGRVDLKLGRLQLSESFDMARRDFASGFFCQGENVRIAPTSWPATPISQWGARVIYRLRDDLSVKVGVMQYNPKHLDTERNFCIGWSGATGVMVPAEISFTPKLAGRLPGTYSVGFWHLNAPTNDPVLNTERRLLRLSGGKPLQHRGQWGYYLTVRQQLRTARPDGSHALSSFFNFSAFTIARRIAISGRCCSARR